MLSQLRGYSYEEAAMSDDGEMVTVLEKWLRRDDGGYDVSISLDGGHSWHPQGVVHRSPPFAVYSSATTPEATP